ncbi:MAG: hypothetical protein KF691_12695 [Phycisphaeraceae bacterium]|nr:hypothetical protein [Phycisphaeraceae bacterium]
MLNKALLAASAGLTAAISASAAPPVIYNLGIYPGGTESHGAAVSHDATYVTGYGDYIFNNQTFYYAFRWSIAGGLVNLGTPANITTTAGNSMDYNGIGIAGNGSNKLFRWTVGGGMQNLGLLTGGTLGLATGISGDTNIVVGYSNTTGGNTYAVKWVNPGGGGLTVLPSLPNGVFGSAAYGISSDGSTIVGGSTWSGSGYRAVRWLPGNIVQDLGPLAGATDLRAYAISKNNVVIVGDAQIPSGDRIFRYVNATMQNLGTPFGTTDSYSRSTNFDGKVVTGRAKIGLNTYRACYWSTNTGMLDLATWVTSLGGNLTGWVLEESWGVSNDGSAIAGTGTFNGQRRAFLIKGLPCPSVATIITDPVDRAVCADPNSSATLGMTIEAPGDVTYQWSVESPPDSGVFEPITGPVFVDSTGQFSFEVAGWDGPEITITGARAVGPIKDIKFGGGVTNPCGTVSTSVARVALCTSDLTCDLVVDDADFVQFAAAYNDLICPGGTPGVPDFCPGDLNYDGFVDDADFVIFAAAYDQLLCV